MSHEECAAPRQLLSQHVHVKLRNSSVMIDHREWKNWGTTEHHGAISKLNELLRPHGVQIFHRSDPFGKDFIELDAVSAHL